MQQKDPLALILAAQIRKGILIEAAKREKTSEGGSETAAGAKEPKDTVDTAEEILAKARQFAGGREDILAMITDVEETAARAAVPGPIRPCESVRAGSTGRYRIRFEGGRRASIGVRGDHDTDLDLYVYDENWNEICSDTRCSDVMRCTWTPRWTGMFVVRIVNLGRVYNRYCLFSSQS